MIACLGLTKPNSLAFTRWNRASSCGSDWPVPGGVLLVEVLQNRDALARKRVGAVVAVRRVDREAIFLVLQLLEELQAALAADARCRKILGAGQVGACFLGAREGEELAERCPLAHRQQAHSRFGRARCDRDRAEDHRCER